MNLSPMIHSDGSSTDLRLIDSEATGDTDAVYDLLGRKRDAQTKGLVIKNGIKVIKNLTTTGYPMNTSVP